MLSSFLAAITCLTIPVSDPLEVAPAMTEGTNAIAVGMHVTPTSFHGRNFSDTLQLLVFVAEGAPEPVIVNLPVGGAVAYEFSPEALRGVSVEVVEVRSEGLWTSGVHPLALPTGSSDMTLWTVLTKPACSTWRQLGCEVELLPPQGSLLPAGSTLNEPGTQDALAPMHVPVAVPRVMIGPGSPGSTYTPM